MGNTGLALDHPGFADDSGRPAYPSVFDLISTEIGWQYGCTPIFLKIRTQSFQKVWKSRRERMPVHCQRSRSKSVDWELSFVDICIFQAISGLKYTSGPDWSKVCYNQ